MDSKKVILLSLNQIRFDERSFFMYTNHDRKEKMETLFTIGAMAVMGAIGILALFCALMGVEFVEVGIHTILGMLFGLSGFLFAIILLVTTSSRS